MPRSSPPPSPSAASSEAEELATPVETSRPSAPVRVGRLLVLLATLTFVGLMAHRYGTSGLVDRALEWIRAAGAPAFFAAVALLPAIGFPLLPFALAAGPAFGPTLGVPLVIAGLTVSIGINVSLSYWLATHTLAPLIPRLCARFGWRLPEFRTRSAFHLVGLVRAAPGLPFWTQSYLLAAVGVPFGPYLLVSTLVPAAYLSCTVIFGNELFHGRVGAALTALVGVAIVAVLLRLLRARSRPVEVRPRVP